jgi:hypothetical protein
MGPAGAQVRCPSCRGVFGVARDGTVREIAAPAPASGGAPRRPATRPAPPAPAPASPPGDATRVAAPAPAPEQVARELVGELAARAGDAPRVAFEGGRLFSEWGPALIELFAEYRRRAGGSADPAPLRAAIRERWGIDLPEGDPRGITG